MILAIDTGTTESGYCMFDASGKPFQFGKVKNEEMLVILETFCIGYDDPQVVVERFASFGMPIGQTTIDAIEWNGRFIQTAYAFNVKAEYVTRKEEKMYLCQSMKANDATIKQRLKDIYGEPGTKKNPGILYGISKDAWSALAVGTTYLGIKEGMYTP